MPSYSSLIIMEYYDLILGSIPASMLGSVGMLNLLGIGVTTGILVGATVAALMILHALFVRAPTRDSEAGPRGAGRSYQSAD